MKLTTLRLTDEMLRIIDIALGEMPPKARQTVVDEINRQILAQTAQPKPDATAKGGEPMGSHSDHPL